MGGDGLAAIARTGDGVRVWMNEVNIIVYVVIMIGQGG